VLDTPLASRGPVKQIIVWHNSHCNVTQHKHQVALCRVSFSWQLLHPFWAMIICLTGPACQFCIKYSSLTCNAVSCASTNAYDIDTCFTIVLPFTPLSSFLKRPVLTSWLGFWDPGTAWSGLCCFRVIGFTGKNFSCCAGTVDVASVTGVDVTNVTFPSAIL
jgi:hypothetical protein